jgi:outer membrane protein assembly factor BamB
MNKHGFVLTLMVTLCISAMTQAADSPRFRGPAADGVFPETGLLKQWPEGGPQLVWSVEGLGKGYSSAVVADNTVYVTGMDKEKQGVLFAYDINGSLKWKTPYGPEFERTGPAPSGTRGTPTIDKDRIILMTGLGKLIIFEADKGQILRTVDLVERFHAEKAKFGYAECVLVDGEKIICIPGAKDAAVVALEKNTGETLWQTKGLSQTSGYCSARLIQNNGQDLILAMLAQGVVALDPSNGKVLWQQDYPNRYGVQPNPPLYADGMVYVTSGGGTGGAMLSLADNDPNTTRKWTDKTLDCQMQGTVLVNGYIYGTAQSANKGLVCLDWNTGKVMWNAPQIKLGVVISADNMLYIYGVDGKMSLVKADPQAFTLISQFPITAGTEEHRAHPTIAHGCLFIRHGDALMAYKIKAES